MLQIRGFLVISVVCTSFVGGCFSSGTKNAMKDEVTKPLAKESEVGALVSELNDNSVRSHPKLLDLSNDEEVQKAYLESFGYMDALQRESTKREGTLHAEALKEFQRFMSISPVDEKNLSTDTRTRSAMLRKRCANPDKSEEQDTKLWEKTTITYRILSYPVGLNATDVRELVAQAFRAWEIVIALDFVEARTESNPSEVDIVFEFSDRHALNKNDTTGFAVAGATSPVNSHIWIKQSERWGTFQKQEADRLDIFLTIVHEIGHILGLQHSTDQSSVMFPIFERQVGEELPVINSNDVERLRNLYDPQNEVVESIPNTGSKSDMEYEECPSALWTITQTPGGRYMLFADNLVYQLSKDKVMIDGPTKIQSVFPKAPQKIAVAISDNERVALIEDKLIYAYEEDKASGKFKLLSDYPKRLHSLVLFYPSTAFPLSNDSVILIDSGVFATYSLKENSPSLLGDKNVKFPNLPEGLRSGIIDRSVSGGYVYDMFTSDAVHKYNLFTNEVTSVESLTKYVRCK